MDHTSKPAPTAAEQTAASPPSEEAGHFVPHPEPLPTPPAPPPPSPGLMRPFLAGLAGGVLAFGLFFGLSQLFNPMADMADRIAAAESNIGSLATRRALETTDKRLAALEARFDPLRSEMETINRSLANSTVVDTTPLVRRLTALETAMAALKQDQPSDKQVTGPTLGTETAKLSLALLISDRLEAGQSFQPELATLELLGLDPALQPLLHDAANGSPSQVQLLSRYSALVPQLRKAIPAASNQTLTDKIWSTLNGVVRIRRTDDTQNSDPESRMHLTMLALQASRTDEALNQFSQLPDPVRAQGRDFETMLHKRLAALAAGDTLIKAASEELLAASRTAKGNGK